jgi:hypothetical protein
MRGCLTASTWREPKHYLGAPVPGATVATVNLAHVVAAVEFTAEETVEQPRDATVLTGADVEPQVGSLSETIERVRHPDATGAGSGYACPPPQQSPGTVPVIPARYSRRRPEVGTEIIRAGAAPRTPA